MRLKCRAHRHSVDGSPCVSELHLHHGQGPRGAGCEALPRHRPDRKGHPSDSALGVLRHTQGHQVAASGHDSAACASWGMNKCCSCDDASVHVKDCEAHHYSRYHTTLLLTYRSPTVAQCRTIVNPPSPHATADLHIAKPCMLNAVIVMWASQGPS